MPPGEAGKGYSVSVNMLCIIGAIVGIFSLFLPWVWTGEGNSVTDSSVYDGLLALHDRPIGWWESLAGVSQILFVSGTVVAFAFPAACSIQAIGIASFYVGHLRTDPFLAYDTGLSIGFLVAMASAALVTASFIAPWGIGFGASQSRWSTRVWTAYLMHEEDGKKAEQSLAWPPDVLRALRMNRKWAVALLASIVSLSAMSYSSSGAEDSGSVGYVDGRIVVSIGGSATLVYWGMTTLSVSNGADSVEWVFEASFEEYTSGEWTPPFMESKDIGELSIAPEVVDCNGEGRVTHGDRIIISPQNATSFVQDTEYVVAIREDSWALDVPLSHLYISFVLADDDVYYDLEVVRTEGWNAHIDYPFWLEYGAVVVFVVLSVVIYREFIIRLQR